MDKCARIILTFGICFYSVTSLGYIHTDEQLANMNKSAEAIQQKLDGFSKNLKGELLAKYNLLRHALDTYATAHAENELDAAGTGWADAVFATKKSVQKEFIDLFTKLDSNQLKEQSELDFKKRDKELNRIYQDLQNNNNLDSEVAAAPSRRGIKNTQRIWIQYRDAWLAFATLKFTTVSQHSLSAALTSNRIEMLKEIAMD